MKRTSEKSYHIPSVPLHLLEILGQGLLVARKERQWRQEDLAVRIGVTRQTVARMEQGDPSVAASHFFTAAWMLDLPIFPGMTSRELGSESILKNIIALLEERSPKRISKSQEKPIDDEF